MTEWRTIDTAPKSETEIDLWVVTVKAKHMIDAPGHRITDCRRIYDGGTWPEVWTDNRGHFVNFSQYYDKHDDWEECLQPGNEPHPEAFLVVKATHWMPKPEGPKDAA